MIFHGYGNLPEGTLRCSRDVHVSFPDPTEVMWALLRRALSWPMHLQEAVHQRTAVWASLWHEMPWRLQVLDAQDGCMRLEDYRGWWFSWNILGWVFHREEWYRLTNWYFSGGLKPPTSSKSWKSQDALSSARRRVDGVENRWPGMQPLRMPWYSSVVCGKAIEFNHYTINFTIWKVFSASL